MKKILFMCLIALGMVFTSCKKENSEQTIEQICGAYNVQHDIISNDIYTGFAYIGLENLTISKDSLLFIDRISDNEIKTYGFFNTAGVVSNDRIIFDPIIFNNSSYFGGQILDSVYCICSFNDAYISNNVINLKINISTYEERMFDQLICHNIENNYKIIAIQIRNYRKQQ